MVGGGVNTNLWPGDSYPLGANFDGSGTNFSVFAGGAEAVELCLFDDDGSETRLMLGEVTAQCHHGYLAGVGPGQRYGFRAHGRWDPARGWKYNPNKLLLDPYARAIEGEVTASPALLSYEIDDPDRMSTVDNADLVPRSVVVSPFFDWGDDRSPRVPVEDSVIYETHVRGMTVANSVLPREVRGTFAGLGSDETVEYLVRLGVTAVELLPVHHFIPELSTLARGLTNYWGYSSIGYLAPHAGYSSSGSRGEQVAEFRRMVKALHAAGIEVILDVVYNHTTEGNERGPVFSFKGLDNRAYYRLDPANPRHYVDFTGTGNTLNVQEPHVLGLIMDSLRYWITEMHVDGFRFDLAPALARELHAVDRLSSFFDLIHQDPVIRRVKLIAEPWDVGDGGYHVGNFPPLWSEWNGRYRDTVRDYWCGHRGVLGDMAARFTGSSDLYQRDGRKPSASINFVTCHDGFTLADLVSYDEKHNEANLEDNRDGSDDNRSWNSGVEGPTDDPEILEVRARRARGILTTLMVSQGVPMLAGGDEIGRTQHGNNNAYCQDNATSWYDWATADAHLADFVAGLIGFRRSHRVFRRRTWFLGTTEAVEAEDDIGWFRVDGTAMSEQDWHDDGPGFGVYLNGDALVSTGPRGERLVDDSFIVLFNACPHDTSFQLPPTLADQGWVRVIDSAIGQADGTTEVDGIVEVGSWSVVVCQRRRGPLLGGGPPVVSVA